MNLRRLAIVLVIAAILVFMMSQWLYLRKAHSTFENYYTFRGCTKLLEKTENEGTCKLASGSVIKIVKFDNKWYLDGDLPWACLGKICFGF
jgi:hypothetical protein